MYTDKHGKKWWKGNLHMHTTRSDGRYPYEEAVRIYQENGYDFVAVTDHFAEGEAGQYQNMLILPGCEFDTGSKDVCEGIYHVLCLGAKKKTGIARGAGAQEIIDAIHAAGGMAVLAHPAWSLNTPEMILALRGIDATEIFNSVSDRPHNCRPYSGLLADMLAVRGCVLPLIADDDAHFYEPGDRCRSYIYAQAEECTQDAIMDALRAGRFYATQGPVLASGWEGDHFYIDCSPVGEIVYFTGNAFTKHRCDIGENLTHGEYVPSDALDRFVRAEVRDKDGKCGWTPYVRVPEEIFSPK